MPLKPTLEIHGFCWGSNGDNNVHVCDDLFVYFCHPVPLDFQVPLLYRYCSFNPANRNDPMRTVSLLSGNASINDSNRPIKRTT